ncbi:MAG: hypothetical protein IJZ42_06715 [Lachnospiraceae bacterium]|nr:hypothetical protein [Lachnospiraceae bacterium]
MSSNFFKSSAVVQEREVRIINSNEIVAKKLESIAQYVKNDAEGELEGVFSEGIEATEVAVLLNDAEGTEDNGFSEGVITAEKGSKADMQITSKNASDIIQKANDEAAQIISEARKEALEIKNEASKSGYEQGYAEGIQKSTAELEKQSEELEKMKKDLESDYRNVVEELEPHLVDVITEVYEHVLGITLDEHREIVMHLINSTLFQMEGVKKFLLHVSKDDYPYISMQKKELVSGTGIGAENVEIVEDFSMKKGQCIIETDGAIFDCGFKTQMEELRKQLKLLSYEQQ